MSPTTSSAANGEAASTFRDPGARVAPADPDETAAQFEGLLWSSVLAPLSQSLGPLGDVLTNAMGTSAAHAEHDAFYDRLRALIELSQGGGPPASDDPR